VALFPVSNLAVPTGIFIAERTLFLPSIGFALAVAGGVAVILPLLESPVHRRVALASLVAVVVAGVARSVERQRVWRHDGFLAVRSVQDSPRSFRAQRAYADVLFELRQPEPARRAYEQAIALSPASLAWRVHNDYARRLRERGDRAAEVEQLRASLVGNADQESARGYLIAALLALGRYDEAAREADVAQSRGDPNGVFAGLRALADSAGRAGAPPGSVNVQINPQATRSR
jgi:tetratricopeptide (TPR) repeat protein